MSTSHAVKRNAYLKEHRKCSSCTVSSCAKRNHPCPYFQPDQEFTLKMLSKIGM